MGLGETAASRAGRSHPVVLTEGIFIRFERATVPNGKLGRGSRVRRPSRGRQEDDTRPMEISISPDGYGAGPNQDLQNPLGGRTELHQWLVPTRTFQRVHFGADGGTTGIDDDFAARVTNVGAWILGRNMFGPIRGLWPDSNWRGWWGQPTLSRSDVRRDAPRPPADPDGGRNDILLRDGRYSRRPWTGRGTPPTEGMCASAAGRTRSGSSIFVRDSSMSCTSRSPVLAGRGRATVRGD